MFGLSDLTDLKSLGMGIGIVIKRSDQSPTWKVIIFSLTTSIIWVGSVDSNGAVTELSKK